MNYLVFMTSDTCVVNVVKDVKEVKDEIDALRFIDAEGQTVGYFYADTIAGYCKE